MATGRRRASPATSSFRAKPSCAADVCRRDALPRAETPAPCSLLDSGELPARRRRGSAGGGDSAGAGRPSRRCSSVWMGVAGSMSSPTHHMRDALQRIIDHHRDVIAGAHILLAIITSPQAAGCGVAGARLMSSRQPKLRAAAMRDAGLAAAVKAPAGAGHRCGWPSGSRCGSASRRSLPARAETGIERLHRPTASAIGLA